MSKWYQDIETLPLARFIDLSVNENIYSLVISGSPGLSELQDAAEIIKAQYSDTMGTAEHTLYISLYREIMVLTITLEQVHLLVDTLSHVYYKNLADKLNMVLGTNLKFNPDDTAGYRKMLNGCLNRSKAFKIDLDLKTIQFKDIQDKNKETQPSKNPYTIKYFLSVLIVLSNYAHYPVTDQITTFEFCTRLKDFNKEQAELKALNEKHKR